MPTKLAVVPQDRAATIRWSLPADAPEVDGFIVRGGPAPVVVDGSAREARLTGLRNGAAVRLTVESFDAVSRSLPAGPVEAVPTNGGIGDVVGLIVKYEEGVGPVDGAGEPVAADAAPDASIAGQRDLGEDLHAVTLEEPVPMAQAREIAAELTADPRIAVAEPDLLVGIAAFPKDPPNDAGYAEQWNLWGAQGIGLGTGPRTMSRVLTRSQGEGSVVAVVDTGVVPHPDLEGALLPGYDFVSDPADLAAVREDGAGPVPFDADATDTARFGAGGWDANAQDPGDWRGVAPVRASTWHGTGIAGVIAARAENGEGVVGVAPQAKVVPVRALSWRGGLLSDVAAGVTWASGGKVPGVEANANPADVVNLSFAVQAPCPVVLQDAIDAAVERGAAVVAAAGNAGENVAAYAPANCRNVIAVAASGTDGHLAPYSNHGAGIDLTAPGGSEQGAIRSASDAGSRAPEGADYRSLEGTSIAAAHVSGALALAKAVQPDTTGAALVEPLLKKGVRAFPAGACVPLTDRACGAGLLDVRSLVQVAAVTVTMPAMFTAPANTNYLVSTSGTTPSVAGFSGSVLVTVQAPSGTTVKVSSGAGLSTVTGYQNPVDTAAQTIAFTGTQSVVNTALASLTYNGARTNPYLVVDATLAGAAYNPANGHYYEAVSAPSGIGWVAARTAAAARTFNGLTGYLATITSSSENAFVVGKLTSDGWIGATDDETYTGLSEGRWKWVTGPVADQVEFWAGGPNGSGGAAVGGNYANWNPGEPNNFVHSGCPAGEDYGQLYAGGSSSGRWNDLPCAAASAGLLTSYVVEYGGAGGTPTEAGTATSNEPPTSPLNVRGTALNASVLVEWNVPASQGAGPITGYQATANPGGATCTPSPATGTSCTISPLTNGQAYTFTVTASNAYNSSAASSVSSSVTPSTVPGAPTAVTATAGDSSATVLWTVPASTGGAAISSYTVTASPGGATCTTSSTSCSVGGLSNGTTYTFTVTATNVAGTGAASSASNAVTPAGAPAPAPAPTSSASASPSPSPTPTVAPLTLVWTPSPFREPNGSGGNMVLGTTGGNNSFVSFILIDRGTAQCTLGGTTVIARGAGTCTIRMFQAANSAGPGQTVDTQVQFLKAAQGLPRISPSFATAGQATRLQPTTNSLVGASSANVWSVTNPGTAGCVIRGGTTLVAERAGTCMVRGYNPGDVNYLPVTGQPWQMNIYANLAEQAPVSFTPIEIPVNKPTQLTPSGGSGTGGFYYYVSSAGTGRCSVTTTGIATGTVPGGTCGITVLRYGDSQYKSITGSINVRVGKADQDPLVMSPVSLVVGDSAQLATTGGTGPGAVTFIVQNPGSAKCSVSGSTITAQAAGSCAVRASKEGSATLNPADAAPITVQVTRREQAPISVIAPTMLAGTPTQLAVEGGSGDGAVTFEAKAGTASCEVRGSMLVVESAGTCSITASKAASPEFNEVRSAPLEVTAIALPVATAGGGPASTAPGTGSAAVGPAPASPTPETSTPQAAQPGARTTESNGTLLGISPSTLPGISAIVARSGPTMQVTLSLAVGAQVEGSTVVVQANGLKPQTPVTVVLYSDPIELSRGTSDEAGNAAIAAIIPAGLPPGLHTLEARGTAPDGSPVQAIAGFTIDDTGIVTAYSPPAQVSEPIAPDSPEIARAVEAGKPLYDPADHPATTAAVTLAAAAFVGLVGFGGLASMKSRGASSGPRRGKLAVVVTKKLKAVNAQEEGAGDRSRTWRLPFTTRMDAWIAETPKRAGRLSALMPRLLVDGAWSRAMFGSGGFLLWLAGLALGIGSAVNAGFSALPPALPWILAILVLGVLDATAGAIAWLTVAVLAVVTGNVTDLNDVRSLLGLFVLYATLPLLAHVIRPLRRLVTPTAMDVFDRVCDYIMMPFFVAFAASSMYNALNGLSGLEVADSGNAWTIRIVVILACWIRLGLEDVAAHAYPVRSKQVQPAKLVSPGKRMALVSVALRVAVFILIAAPFFGLGWITFTAAALVAIPMVLKVWEDDLPNSVALNKWFPRGLARFFLLLVIGIYLSAWLLGQEATSEQVRQTYTIILLPGIISGIVELFGREGGTWPDTWLKRIAGGIIWVTAAAITLGLVSLA